MGELTIQKSAVTARKDVFTVSKGLTMLTFNRESIHYQERDMLNFSKGCVHCSMEVYSFLLGAVVSEAKICL